MYLFCMIILIFFAVIGLSAFVSAILGIMYQNSTEAVLQLKNLTTDNAEARIRSAAYICRRYRGIRLQCFCDENDPAFDICKLLQTEYPFMEIIQTKA